MIAATATSDSAIFYRSRRRVAVWALALALGGAAAGTAATLAVTHDDNSGEQGGVPRHGRASRPVAVSTR